MAARRPPPVLDDLAEVLDELPGRLVIGTGAQGRMDRRSRDDRQLTRRGIVVEVLSTHDAVRRYRALDPAATAAALHLTC